VRGLRGKEESKGAEMWAMGLEREVIWLHGVGGKGRGMEWISGWRAMSLDRRRFERPCSSRGVFPLSALEPRFSPKSERGFTLLEVMVSLVILGMGILMIIQLFSGGLGLARAARDHSGAVLLAREKMAEVLTDENWETGVSEGEGPKGFTWKVDVSPYESALTDDNVSLDIMKVDVSVLGRGKVRGAYTLSSLKLLWYEDADEE